MAPPDVQESAANKRAATVRLPRYASARGRQNSKVFPRSMSMAQSMRMPDPDSQRDSDAESFKKSKEVSASFDKTRSRSREPSFDKRRRKAPDGAAVLDAADQEVAATELPSLGSRASQEKPAAASERSNASERGADGGESSGAAAGKKRWSVVAKTMIASHRKEDSEAQERFNRLVSIGCVSASGSSPQALKRLEADAAPAPTLQDLQTMLRDSAGSSGSVPLASPGLDCHEPAGSAGNGPGGKVRLPPVGQHSRTRAPDDDAEAERSQSSPTKLSSSTPTKNQGSCRTGRELSQRKRPWVMAKVFGSTRGVTRGVRPSGKPQAPFIPLYSTEVPFYVYINAAKEKAEELINLGLFENTMFNKWPQTPELQPTAMASAITALQKEKEDIEAERLMSTSKRGFFRSNSNSRRYSLGESS